MAAITRMPRRFALADAMALVAAVAVGLVLTRVWTRFADERRTYQSVVYSGPLELLSPVTGRAVQYWPVVAVLSPTLLVLRARRPRPTRSRLFAPPGVAACATATIAMVLEGLSHSLFIVLHSSSLAWEGIQLDHIDVLNLTLATIGALSSTAVGVAVAAAWGSMALAGRWRPERGWIDRAGRVVGLLWIVLIPIRLHFNLFRPYLSG